MAFFEDLTKKTKDLAYVAADKAKDVAAVAADKAKDAAELTRISMAIAGEQREIDKNYRTIGEWFVSEYEGEIPDAVRDLVEAVNTSKAKIAELEASKPRKDDGAEVEAAAPAQKICPICGAASDSKFCPQCGAPVPPAACTAPQQCPAQPLYDKPAGLMAGGFSFSFKRSGACHTIPRRRGWTGRRPRSQSRIFRSSGPACPYR